MHRVGTVGSSPFGTVGDRILSPIVRGRRTPGIAGTVIALSHVPMFLPALGADVATDTRRGRRSQPLLAGVAVAVLWVVLAALRPTTTWHLAPLFVVAAPSWIAMQNGDVGGIRWWLWPVIGTVVGLLATVLLVVLDLLRGPSLVGGTATIESLLAVAAGLVIGVVLTRLGSAR